MTAHPAKGQAPAKPRDAASLLIYRYSNDALEVLMGRRRSGARFLPDQYVFPGGGVEPADFDAAELGGPDVLQPPVPRPETVGVAHKPCAVVAICQAAIREAEEETGLVLQAGALLTYLGRAITPTFSPVRYHARFFAAPLASFGGSLGGDGELVDLRWVRADRAADITMIDVTAFMLQALVQQLQGASPGWARLSYVGNAMRVAYAEMTNQTLRQD